jgi:hypothetical protein
MLMGRMRSIRRAARFDNCAARREQVRTLEVSRGILKVFAAPPIYTSGSSGAAARSPS